MAISRSIALQLFRNSTLPNPNITTAKAKEDLQALLSDESIKKGEPIVYAYIDSEDKSKRVLLGIKYDVDHYQIFDGNEASDKINELKGNIKTINGETILGTGDIKTVGVKSTEITGFQPTITDENDKYYTYGETFNLTKDIQGESGTLAANVATGAYSHAEGFSTKGTEIASHAEGWGATASGKASHAEGRETAASGDASHAEGAGAVAIGTYSHAEGFQSKANEHSSHAEGYRATASGKASHAEGRETIASGDMAHAEGKDANAMGVASHAEGYDTIASGDASHAEGFQAQNIYLKGNANATEYQIVAGMYFTEIQKNPQHMYDFLSNSSINCIKFYDDSASAKVVRFELRNNDTELWIIVDKTLNAAEAIDDTKSKANKGIYFEAKGHAAHTEGAGTSTTGIASHAEGGAAAARGNYSHAEGEYAISFGDTSHAEGYSTKSLGKISHAEGLYSIASGEASHAEGAPSYSVKTEPLNELYTITILKSELLADPRTRQIYNESKGQILHIFNSALDANGINGVESWQNNINALKNAGFGSLGDDATAGYFKDGKRVVSNIQKCNNAYYNNKELKLEFQGPVYSEIELFGDGQNSVENNISFEIESKITGVDIDLSMGISTALGYASHAEGMVVQANSSASHAEGKYTNASGEASHAEGSQTAALGDSSHAEGDGTTASGYNSHAEGYYTTASGYNSHAEGESCLASGYNSHAEGRSTIASGDYSHVEGDRTIASGYSSHAEGKSSNTIPEGTDLTNDEAIKTAWTTTKFSLAKGEASHVSGNDCLALGDYSFAEGRYTIASGNFGCHAEGNRSRAHGTASHAEGNGATASGISSHAEGNYTTASSESAHAEGSQTAASGFGAHAEGFYTIASGDYSHAEGWSTIASGIDSHAEGNRSRAHGTASHAEGISSSIISEDTDLTNNEAITSAWNDSHFSLARGEASRVSGKDCLALGNYSSALGLGTITSNETEVAMGQYNKTREGLLYSFGIGDGVKTEWSDGRNNMIEITKVITKSTMEGGEDRISYEISMLPNKITIGGDIYMQSAVNSFDIIPAYESTAESGWFSIGYQDKRYNTGYIDNIHAKTLDLGWLKTDKDSNIWAPVTYDADNNPVYHDIYINYMSECYDETTGNPLSHVCIGRKNTLSHLFSVAGSMYADSIETPSLSITDNLTAKTLTVTDTLTVENLRSSSAAEVQFESTALGKDTHATGFYSLAVGEGSSAGQPRAVAMGNHTEAFGTNAVATGSYSQAHKDNSFASGDHVQSLNISEASFGKFNKSSVNQIFSIGIGEAGTSSMPAVRKNALEIYNNGSVYIKGVDKYDGQNVTNVKSLQEVINSKLDIANAVGKKTETNGEIFNDYTDNKALGLNSHAEGGATTASGSSSHAEGEFTISSGIDSHAEGNRSRAHGTASHAEGISSNIIPEGTDLTNDEAIQTAWESTKFSLAKGNASHVSGNDCLALGDNSFASGWLAIASGMNSHAEGRNVTASGFSSYAEGNGATASGNSSHAEGAATTASGGVSHAEGLETVASGHNGSHAEGRQTTASGYSSHAEGMSSHKIPDGTDLTNNDAIITEWQYTPFSLAKGEASHVSGNDCLALGDYSFAEGYQSTAIGKASHAEGGGNDEYGEYKGGNALALGSHAEGFYTNAGAYKCIQEYDSHKWGEISITKPVDIPEGEDISSYWVIDGDSSHAEGWGATASGKGAHAEGCETIASGYNSHAEGYQTVAEGEDSHVEGYKTRAYNQGYYQFSVCHAEGYQTVVNGWGSHAEGWSQNMIPDGIDLRDSAAVEAAWKINPFTAAIGTNGSHAEGDSCLALEFTSHAEGFQTVAETYSHAEGYQTAAKSYSHAEGYGTTALGFTSHAEGRQTTASGYSSHTEGSNTTAENYAQHTQGAYNVADTNTPSAMGFNPIKPSFVVGNGSSSNANHDSLRLLNNGNLYLQNVGGFKGDEEYAVFEGAITEGPIIQSLQEVIMALNAKIAELESKLAENEQITAAALNALNTEVKDNASVTAVAITQVNDRIDKLTVNGGTYNK